MRWQRKRWGITHQLVLLPSRGAQPVCTNPTAGSRAQVTAAEDTFLMHAPELGGCGLGQPYHSCLRLGLGVLEERGCLNHRAGEDTSWKAP